MNEFRKNDWHLPDTILNLLIGKACSVIASIMGFIVHFTHYIAFLASAIKIICLWYKTKEFTVIYLISTHSMNNLELWSLKENFLLKKMGLAHFLSASFIVVVFLLDNTGYKQKTKN